MAQGEPDPNLHDSSTHQRAWLASLLLRSQQTWFGRFAFQLRRLAGLRRGQRRRLQRKAAVSLAGAALVLSLGANLMRPITVHAATINVDNNQVTVANDGFCSVQEAILNANTNSQVYAAVGECESGAGGSDTINLPAAGTFSLPNPYGYYYGAGTGLPLITTDIVIEGNGSAIHQLPGGNEFRIMAVGTSGNLTLRNTIVAGGVAGGADGGGLWLGGTALIEGSTFTENYAGADGGAIKVETGGTLTFNSGRVSGNFAVGRGGGIETEGDVLLTIDDSEISNNESGNRGGGIYAERAEVIIRNNTIISGNRAITYGGGAAFLLSDVTITDSAISGNYATYEGGGLHLFGSTTTITGSVISNNDTSLALGPYFGGGIFNSGGLLDPECEVDCETAYSELTITESTISGNTSFQGGGIFNDDYNYLAIHKSTVTANEAPYFGGGIANSGGYIRVVNSTVSGNRATGIYLNGNYYTGYGGGIMSSGPDLEDVNQIIVLSTITGNFANGKGGGIYNISGGLGIIGSIVSGNTSGAAGNEVYNLQSSGAYVLNSYNLVGHSGETTAQAMVDSTIDPNTIVATSDGTLPTALAAILNTTLASNGGPTETHALVADSPAVDYLPAAACDPGSPIGDLSEDQRSEPRNIDIPGMGNDGMSKECDIGAYELQLPTSGAFCPVDGEGVGYLRTDALGIGQGSPTKGFRTRKLVVPNSNDVVSLYGQLAALDIGVMRFVRFLPQGEPKIQIHPPTSLAYRPHAVSWWGSDLPTGVNWVKGQFFWGKKANKSPRAFVLWPTYETDERYANVFETFDESIENHVSFEPGFIAGQEQTLALPEVQADGATVNVTVALVDVNNDARHVTLTVDAGNVAESRVVTVPNKGQLLNLEEFVLEDVNAGTDEVVITLESEEPDGDSAAMIGAAANYWCAEEELPEPIPGPQAPSPDGVNQSSYWDTLANRFAQLRSQQPAAGQRQADGENGRFWSQWIQSRESGRQLWAERGDDR